MKTLPIARYKIFTFLPSLAFALLLVQYLKLKTNIYNKTFARNTENFKSREVAVDCRKIIKGDPRVLENANNTMNRVPKRFISPQEYIKLASNCRKFKHTRGYVLNALSKNEDDFSIGYSINIYKDFEQFERLLRAIYRPQNLYCVHVDKKSPEIFHRAVQTISNCFTNVFLASTSIDVQWGEFSVLQSDLICMRDLWHRSRSWTYFINLTGQEFPLKTNKELVKILQKLRGKSIVYGERPKTWMIKKRFLYVHHGIQITKKRKKPFRGNKFTFYKGSTHVVLSRAFVNFTLHDKLAKDFLEWVRDTGVPDETFYSTLYLNLDFDNNLEKHSYSPRYKNWVTSSGSVCLGKVVRHICINGIGDLKSITRRRAALFVNKFHLDYQYLALDCLEQWLHNRTLVDHTSEK